MATSTSASGAGPATPPAVSLPKGGGAIRGIGEKFGANPVTGTGSITDRGVPRYGEDPADTFVLSGAEDLVEYLGRTAGDRQPEPDPRHEAGISYTVRRYRPRIEGLFARIERWTETATGDVHWGSVTRDNVTSVYGRDDASRLSDRQPTCRSSSTVGSAATGSGSVTA